MNKFLWIDTMNIGSYMRNTHIYLGNISMCISVIMSWLTITFSKVLCSCVIHSFTLAAWLWNATQFHVNAKTIAHYRTFLVSSQMNKMNKDYSFPFFFFWREKRKIGDLLDVQIMQIYLKRRFTWCTTNNADLLEVQI